jgi:hypothetical protein
MLVISFFRIAMTHPGGVPDDELWEIQIPDNIPVELQSEFLALTVERREEILLQSRNILTSGNINTNDETTCSSGKAIF